MQYILTQQELDDLRDRAKVSPYMPDRVLLQAVCTKIANEWPVKYWNNKEAHIWVAF